MEEILAVNPGLWELFQGAESRMDVGSVCCFNHCLLCMSDAQCNELSNYIVSKENEGFRSVWNDSWDQSGSESWVKCEQPSLEWQDFDIEAVRSE